MITVRPIPAPEALPLIGALARVCGKALISQIGAAIRDTGPDGDAAAAAVVMRALREEGGLLALLGAGVDALAHPEMPGLIRSLCSYALLDGEPLESDADFDRAFGGDPWGPFTVAWEVLVKGGFFSLPRTWSAEQSATRTPTDRSGRKPATP